MESTSLDSESRGQNKKFAIIQDNKGVSDSRKRIDTKHLDHGNG